MGYRTIVCLNNDQAHLWEKDPELGRKIGIAMNFASDQTGDDSRVGSYGRVVQCVHADVQTLAVLTDYSSFRSVASKAWTRGESSEDIALRLVKEAAEKLGYRLVKKATPQAVSQ